MSSLIEEASAGLTEASESIRRAEERLNEAAERLNQATESLRRAEDRLNAYMLGAFILPPGFTFQFLQDEVTACRAVLAGAQGNYDNTLAAQNRGNLVV